MTKAPWIIGAALALAGGVATLSGGVDAWDRWRLPRPVMTPELRLVSEQATDAQLRALILQKKDAENSVTDLEVYKAKIIQSGEQVPQAIDDALAEKKILVDEYQNLIVKIKNAAP